MSQKLTCVGKRITQKDVLLKATGEARYVPDVRLPGMLWGKCFIALILTPKSKK